MSSDQESSEYHDNKTSCCQTQSNHQLHTSQIMPESIESILRMSYRSLGLGAFGATMRFIGMPLEKIALYMNSAQVTGKRQLTQAIKLTFQNGILTPYRVVSPTSGLAWFLQYSVMGMVFQSVDKALSHCMGVPLMPYGAELMNDPRKDSLSSSNLNENQNVSQRSFDNIAFGVKIILAPILSGIIESVVANRAEVQRYYGIHRLAQIESQLQHNPLRKLCGPAFLANSCRNSIMSCTSFVITPILYRNYFPQESKNKTTLFWFGLGVNIFIGNVVAITQQSLWGRALDYCISSSNGIARNIHYKSVVQAGLDKEGYAAFFTLAKFSSRVMMNAPVQGTLPWFYNEVLPIWEPGFIKACQNAWISSSFPKGQHIEKDGLDVPNEADVNIGYNEGHKNLLVGIGHDVTTVTSTISHPPPSNSSFIDRNNFSMVQATSGYTNRGIYFDPNRPVEG